MRTVFAFPGNMAHAQNAARALFEAESLEAYVTTFSYRQNDTFASALRALPEPFGKRILAELSRRAITQVPPHLIHTYPTWEVVRTLAQKAGAGAAWVDRIWDIESHRFDALVARKYVSRAEAVHTFEYGALASFQRAAKEGVGRILHLPSLDSGQFRAVEARERANWPELVRPTDAYFERKFQTRQDRRLAEIALADVIICNSSLTARSHIASGADPAKVFVVRLGAPPTIDAIQIRDGQRKRPLNVVSAGPFSLRKGAHYLLDAWRRLNAGRNAVLNVYGKLELPERLIADGTQGIVFHGSTPQSELFAAFEEADVLVFPTLSDGFGMVIAEAFAHGLPVITTEQAGAAELVTRDNGVIVPVADPQAVTNALQWCLDNREKLETMRGSALSTARQRQWSHFRRDLIAILNTALRWRGYTPAFKPLP